MNDNVYSTGSKYNICNTSIVGRDKDGPGGLQSMDLVEEMTFDLHISARLNYA